PVNKHPCQVRALIQCRRAFSPRPAPATARTRAALRERIPGATAATMVLAPYHSPSMTPDEKKRILAPLDADLERRSAEWSALHAPIPKYLFHYTSSMGLLGVLASQRVWATNIRYMNDASELLWACNLTHGFLRARAEQES